MYSEQKFSNLIGFVSQNGISVRHNIDNIPNYNYLIMTPGVRLIPDKEKDQNYMSLKEAKSRTSDIIIVGSHICNSDNPAQMAKTYQETYWTLM